MSVSTSACQCATETQSDSINENCSNTLTRAYNVPLNVAMEKSTAFYGSSSLATRCFLTTKKNNIFHTLNAIIFIGLLGNNNAIKNRSLLGRARTFTAIIIGFEMDASVWKRKRSIFDEVQKSKCKAIMLSHSLAFLLLWIFEWILRENPSTHGNFSWGFINTHT